MIKSILKSVLPRNFRPGVHVLNRTGGRVAGGCFAGLSYAGDSVGSAFLPKLLGTYERELAPVIEEIVRGRFDQIVDIGAAEGYYAVGLARLLPDATVVAFERTEAGRALLSEMAAANGVADRVLVRGNCEAADLRDCLASMERPVIICDVEGYERTLLDPDLVPALARASILVEIHEISCPDVGRLLEGRFRGTHRIEAIGLARRSTADLPFRTLYMRLIPRRFLLNLLDEWRTDGMAWLWMRPRDVPGGGDDATAGSPAREAEGTMTSPAGA